MSNSRTTVQEAATVLLLCGAIACGGAVNAQSEPPAPSTAESAVAVVPALEPESDVEALVAPDENQGVQGGFPCLHPDPMPECYVFQNLLCVLSYWQAVYPNTGLGDYNLNGVVDFDDIIFVLAHWC